MTSAATDGTTRAAPATSGRPVYLAPLDLSDALAMLAEDAAGTAILGGGTVVMPRLATGAERPGRLLDLAAVPGLADVTTAGGTSTLGATVTYATLLGRSVHPLLRQVARGITGGPQIRNQGTVGGSLCHANPASDLPAALAALGARVTLERPGARRTLSLADFVVGPYQTAIAPGEILTAVEIPDGDARYGYVKIKHGHSSWPLAVAAARISRAGRHAITVTLGAAVTRPTSIEINLDGELGASLTPSQAVVVAETVRAAGGDWWADELATARYRRRVCGVLAVRAIDDALRKEPSA